MNSKLTGVYLAFIEDRIFASDYLTYTRTILSLMSFDFVDLDEESFSNLKDFSNFKDFSNLNDYNNNSNYLKFNQTTPESSIFIRSTSPVCTRQVAATGQALHNIEIILPIGSVIRFNPKGTNYEGRDSKVFRGEMVTNEIVSQVAIKIYKSDQNAVEGAKKEIKIAQNITNNRSDFLKLFYSGIVTLISSSESEFISVWEWIDGGTIDRQISKLSDSQIKNIIKSLANSIGYLHNSNLAHHDLKPQNILITTDLQRTIIIDFGDSKHIHRNHGHDHTNLPLDEGIGLGTLAYTAPELLSRKSSFYDPFATDVYSFGVLLFYFLNKGTILPFQALIPHRAVQLILNVQKGFFAGGYNPEKPRDSPFYPLMLKCLKVDPRDRPKFPEIINNITLASLE